MDDSGLRRGGALVLLRLAPLFPPTHMVALRRTAGGGLPPLPVVPLVRRMVPVLFLLDDAPMVGRGGVPLAVPTADRLRIDANVAADNGRRGGVPPLPVLPTVLPTVPEGEIDNRDEPYEPDDDDNRLRLPAVVVGPPSYDPRLPKLDRPKLPEDDRPRPPPLLLPPVPAEPAEPTELHLGRRPAFLFC